jgi:flagellar motor switch protein FliM
MCLEISPLIIYPIIDRLLGGSSAELFIPQRPLTLIELRLVGRIIDRALNCLSEVWSSLVPVKFALSEVESNPHLVQIVAPNEVVVVIGFEIKMGPRAGTMSLSIPFNVIEPVMAKLAAQGWAAYQRRSAAEDRTQDISGRLSGAEIELQAYLAETAITVRDLLGLAPGDIVQTTKPAVEPVIIQVEGRNKFKALVGRHKENRAVKITGPAPNDDKL